MGMGKKKEKKRGFYYGKRVDVLQCKVILTIEVFLQPSLVAACINPSY